MNQMKFGNKIYQLKSGREDRENEGRENTGKNEREIDVEIER